ncbi:MAG TPA: UDP-N-acetylmuramoyl-tripeptide--D-alanyl-D-alanine ligase, partial [Glaciecola sp.]|nr:UDP-N-acetylmuramoyl-tripeptide--D-alanyl-D-alanine ligase [Glaciecola sp.]
EPLLTALYGELQHIDEDITILVKGSRSARMERVVTALEASPVGKLDRSMRQMAC